MEPSPEGILFDSIALQVVKAITELPADQLSVKRDENGIGVLADRLIARGFSLDPRMLRHVLTWLSEHGLLRCDRRIELRGDDVGIDEITRLREQGEKIRWRSMPLGELDIEGMLGIDDFLDGLPSAERKRILRFLRTELPKTVLSEAVRTLVREYLEALNRAQVSTEVLQKADAAVGLAGIVRQYQAIVERQINR